MKQDQIVIYQTEDGQTQIDVRLENETVWLTQAQMAELFQTDRTSIVRHINNIYKVEELDRESTCAKIAQVQIEGKRTVKRNIPYFNLDMIISVGYRVNSKRGVKFRQWANRVLKDVSIDIDDNTRACLVNTLLFNASWAQMFYKTKKDKFYKTPKEVRTVDMMCNTEKEHYYKYMQNSQYQMLRLPYVGSFYMDVILPNKNITNDHLMAHLDFKQYEESTQKLNTYDIVEVGLPKFHVKSELNFLQLLSDMGLSDLFSMSADYSLMSDSSLYINRMRQDIEMDIDEKGTHVEAVTSTSFATKGEMLNPTKAVFYANRPFIYFIRDGFGAICFAGVYHGGK